MKQNQKRGKNFLYPFLAMLIGSIMLIATIFMPFASSTENYRKYLEKYPDSMFAEELNMTNEDAINLSLFEYARIYSSEMGLKMAKSISIACLVLIGMFGVFALLTLLFSILKKAIPTIIFNLLTLALFIITKWDFKDRGVIPSSRWDWGTAQYICYIGVAVVLAGAVTLLVIKIKDKKQSNVSELK